jgi:hypothetical protein
MFHWIYAFSFVHNDSTQSKASILKRSSLNGRTQMLISYQLLKANGLFFEVVSFF